jgi:DNA-binding transcriptional ArsR family regulator
MSYNQYCTISLVQYWLYIYDGGMSTPSQDQSQSKPQVVDVIAALHHPVRRKLYELLNLDGPSTVSRLAEAAQERVGNASHHLLVLAEAGLVEEAPELAKDRRERWWRADPSSISWSIADVVGDPVGEVVVSAAEQQNLAHHVGKVQQWYARREMFDPEWVRAALSTDGWLSVSPAELEELGNRITDLMREYGATAERQADPRRERVFAFAHAVPAKP